MLIPFFWNIAAWLAWGILILVLRFNVERQQQQIDAQEAQEALKA
jgi:heme exporter protein C